MSKKPAPAPAVNAIADDALAAIQKIKDDAKVLMSKQEEKIKEAKATIRQRIKELEAQEETLNKALEEITGKAPAGASKGGTREDLTELRQRIVNWLTGRAGDKYSGKVLKKHFTELETRSVSLVLSSVVKSGEIKTEGAKASMVYFVPKK